MELPDLDATTQRHAMRDLMAKTATRRFILILIDVWALLQLNHVFCGFGGSMARWDGGMPRDAGLLESNLIYNINPESLHCLKN